jgi:hypothetical protein
MTDPNPSLLTSFSFSDDERAAIELALQQKNPWNEKDPKLKSVKDCLIAYSRPRLPLIPVEACHPFHAKAATDSTATLPPRQVA